MNTTEELDALRVKVTKLCPDIAYLCPAAPDGFISTFWKPGTRFTNQGFNPTTDLNACAEIEKTITPEQLNHYDRYLCGIVEKESPVHSYNHPQEYVWHATAEQRCRAFVALHEGKSVR